MKHTPTILIMTVFPHPSLNCTKPDAHPLFFAAGGTLQQRSLFIFGENAQIRIDDQSSATIASG